MTARRICWLCSAVAAIPLSLAGGWCWNKGCDPLYVAAARVSIPVAMTNLAPGQFSIPGPEESFLSAEVVAAASDLLHERGISLPTESRFDSDVDYLLERLGARCDRDGEQVDVELTYRTPDAERAVLILAAVVEAGVRALQPLTPNSADAGNETLAPEKRQLEGALAAAQAQIAELERRIAGEDAELLDPDQAARTIRDLSDALDRARSLRIDAEDHLALASRDLRSGVAVEQILVGLSKAMAGTESNDAAESSSLRDELRQIEQSLESSAGIYGRNHPHMVGLRAQLDRVRQKLAEEAGLLSSSTGTMISSKSDELRPGLPVVAAQLLRKLEEKLREAIAAEQTVERDIERAQAESSERQAIQAGLVAARQELAFLQQEYSRVCREFDAERRVAHGRHVNVTDAPMLLPETIAPPLAGHLVWFGLLGVVISGGLLRQFQMRSGKGPAPADTVLRLTSMEQYRSQQEDNLARLRRLKPVA